MCALLLVPPPVPPTSLACCPYAQRLVEASFGGWWTGEDKAGDNPRVLKDRHERQQNFLHFRGLERLLLYLSSALALATVREVPYQQSVPDLAPIIRALGGEAQGDEDEDEGSDREQGAGEQGPVTGRDILLKVCHFA